MAFDYTEIATVAEELVTEFGRTITLVRTSETPADASKPWDGSAEVLPADADGDDLSVPGVQLLPNAVRIFGLSALGQADRLYNLVSKSELVYVVFQGENDLAQYTFVRDDGVDFFIQATQALKPANTTLLGFIGVRR